MRRLYKSNQGWHRIIVEADDSESQRPRASSCRRPGGVPDRDGVRLAPMPATRREGAHFRGKARPRSRLIAMWIASGAARDLALFNDEAEALAEAFWPGPLTLVLPRSRARGIASASWSRRASIRLSSGFWRTRLPSAHGRGWRLIEARREPFRVRWPPAAMSRKTLAAR